MGLKRDYEDWFWEKGYVEGLIGGLKLRRGESRDGGVAASRAIRVGAAGHDGVGVAESEYRPWPMTTRDRIERRYKGRVNVLSLRFCLLRQFKAPSVFHHQSNFLLSRPILPLCYQVRVILLPYYTFFALSPSSTSTS
jgi:hypothetical protein